MPCLRACRADHGFRPRYCDTCTLARPLLCAIPSDQDMHAGTQFTETLEASVRSSVGRMQIMQAPAAARSTATACSSTQTACKGKEAVTSQTVSCVLQFGTIERQRRSGWHSSISSKHHCWTVSLAHATASAAAICFRSSKVSSGYSSRRSNFTRRTRRRHSGQH